MNRDATMAVDRPRAAAAPTSRFGSDAIAAMLRALDIEFVALCPGASFRGLHDSLVNHLGNTRPELLLVLHEEHSVAIAHGYARVTGRPMAVALHSNVGLMHATMAIFNAWCDRVPMLLLGGVGPMDAVRRRPWVDWIHTSRDLGALVRGYTKWDDQPGSVPAALEALMRACQITATPPAAPVYVCLDAAIQEQAVETTALPAVERFRAATPAEPSPQAVARASIALFKAAKPLILVGRVSNDPSDWQRRVALAERLDARVLTDLKTGASFPTAHRLHPHAPGILLSAEACALIREADVILSFDWVDLAGTFRLACGGEWPKATIIQCSVDQYLHNGWSMDYQALPPADVSILASPDTLVRALLDTVPVRASAAPAREPARPAADVLLPAAPIAGISIDEFARITTDALADCAPSYIRLPIGWPGDQCRFAHPLDYIGFDGAGGLGSGPGMAVGAAIALRATDRLPVAILGDGDYLMGLTALWTAVHYRIPLLVVVANNHSFFNDELHQERMARERGRPVENRWIGARMSNPTLNLARLADGQGAIGLGPVADAAALSSSLATAIENVRAGAVCVIDVHVATEYARGLSSALLRRISDE